jgi:hypothetical protein
MGYEKGSVYFYKNKFWLFSRYGTVRDFQQYVVLHGLDGEVVEAKEADCQYVLSPSEIKIKED